MYYETMQHLLVLAQPVMRLQSRIAIKEEAPLPRIIPQIQDDEQEVREEGVGNQETAIRYDQMILMAQNIGLKVMEVKNYMIQRMRLIYQHPFQLSTQCRDVYQRQKLMKTPYAHFPQRVDPMELEMLHPLKM